VAIGDPHRAVECEIRLAYMREIRRGDAGAHVRIEFSCVKREAPAEVEAHGVQRLGWSRWSPDPWPSFLDIHDSAEINPSLWRDAD